MLSNSEIVRFLAIWELIHESTDEALKASVARGVNTTQGEMATDNSAFVDGLAAMVNARKDIIKAELASGTDTALEEKDSPTTQAIEELRFEVAELRGRLESMNATIDAVHATLDAIAAKL